MLDEISLINEKVVVLLVRTTITIRCDAIRKQNKQTKKRTYKDNKIVLSVKSCSRLFY